MFYTATCERGKAKYGGDKPSEVKPSGRRRTERGKAKYGGDKPSEVKPSMEETN